MATVKITLNIMAKRQKIEITFKFISRKWKSILNLIEKRNFIIFFLN